MIGDLLSRINKADNIDSVDALTASVRNGTIPAFIGVPMIADLVKKQQAARGLAQGAPTTTIADQVMQQAQALNQPQPAPYEMAATERPPIPTQIPPQNPMPPREMVAGLPAAQSNLPTQNMAGGGIVAFAGDTDGSLVDDEYDPEEDEANEEYYADMEHQSRLAQMLAQNDALTEGMLDDDMLGAAPATTVNKGIAYKEPMPAGASKGMQDKSFTGKIRHLESRGRDYDQYGNILTSPKGAMGSMQTMPGTLRDPGFGVRPARDNSVAEMNRVGEEYAAAMLNRYKNEKDAAMAYNWGPGRVDAWIAGGRKGPVPSETRQYASNFAEGGIVNLAVGGTPPYTTTSGTGTLYVDPEGNVVSSKDMSRASIRPSIDDLLKGKMPAGPQNPFPQTNSSASTGPSIRSLMPKGGDEYTNVYPAMGSGADASYLNQLLIESQKDPSYQPYKDEIAALLKKNPSLESIVAAQNKATNQPVISNKPENKPWTEEQLRKSEDRFRENKKGLFPEAPIKTEVINTNKTEEDPQAKAQQALFEQMQDAYKKREAGLESDKTLDNYLAVLQGFLGMMGGQSPYALSNIGQGASSGISYLLNARKLQGQAERALGREQASLLNAKLSENYKNAVLGQNEKKMNALAVNNRLLEANRVRDDYNNIIEKWEKNNAQLLGLRNNLLGFEASGKITKEQKTKLDQINQEIKDVEARARKSTGYGVNSSGWSAEVVQPGNK
jgi:soluble lytic murein transglycosylase-like protein